MNLDPVNNLLNYKMGIMYWNPNDSRFLVFRDDPRAGYTLNFAHRNTFIISFIVSVLFVLTLIYQ